MKKKDALKLTGYEILKNNPTAVAIIAPDASLKYVNPAFEKLFGYKSSELIGKKPPYPYWPHEKIVGIKKILKDAMKSGVKKFEIQLMKKNKELIWIEADSVPVMKNGRLDYYLSNLIDITLRKEAEVKFRKAYSELEIIFNAAEDGMRIIDTDFNVLKANKKFCNITGLSLKENLKRKCYESLPGNNCNNSRCNLKQILSGVKSFESEVSKVGPGNKKILCHITATPLKADDGKTIGAVMNYKVLTERVKAGKDLKDSEERYRNIFNSAGVSLWEEDYSEVYSMLEDLKSRGVTDIRKYLKKHPEFIGLTASKVKVIDVNDQTLKIYGAKDKTELMGSLDKIFIPETFEKFGDQLIAMFEGKSYFETEFLMHDIQNNIINALGALRLPINSNQSKRVIVSLLDITDRKKSEEKILDLAKFPSENPNPVIRIDKTGKVIYSNEAGVEQLKDLKSKVGKKAPKIFYNIVSSLFKEKSQKSETINITLGKHIFEYIITPIIGSDYANLYGRDITDRVKVEEDIKKYSENLEELVRERTEGLEILNKELVESENKYRELFELNKDGILLTGMDGYFIDTNKAFRDMTGYSKDGLKQMTFFDLTPVKWHELNKSIIKNQILARGSSDEFEKEYIKKNGTVFPVSVQTWLVKDKKGKPAGYWSITRDLTQIKSLQHENLRNEKLKVLGQLAGGVGHELRNPLTAIKNASYFLNMSLDKEDDDIKETLDIINNEVDASNKIISDLLDFSKTKQMTFQKVSIVDTLEKSINSLSVPENIKTGTRLYKKMPKLMGDPGQLVQIFSNIILNAFQAMPEGGKLNIRSSVSNKKWAKISFTDTGIGIPEENVKDVFEPLFTTKAKGIGLGMALTKILVDAHKGKIEVKSKAGEGTTFTVSLPLK